MSGAYFGWAEEVTKQRPPARHPVPSNELPAAGGIPPERTGRRHFQAARHDDLDGRAGVVTGTKLHGRAHAVRAHLVEPQVRTLFARTSWSRR